MASCGMQKSLFFLANPYIWGSCGRPMQATAVRSTIYDCKRLLYALEPKNAQFYTPKTHQTLVLPRKNGGYPEDPLAGGIPLGSQKAPFGTLWHARMLSFPCKSLHLGLMWPSDVGKSREKYNLRLQTAAVCPKTSKCSVLHP